MVLEVSANPNITNVQIWKTVEIITLNIRILFYYAITPPNFTFQQSTTPLKITGSSNMCSIISLLVSETFSCYLSHYHKDWMGRRISSSHRLNVETMHRRMRVTSIICATLCVVSQRRRPSLGIEFQGKNHLQKTALVCL